MQRQQPKLCAAALLPLHTGPNAAACSSPSSVPRPWHCAGRDAGTAPQARLRGPAGLAHRSQCRGLSPSTVPRPRAIVVYVALSDGADASCRTCVDLVVSVSCLCRSPLSQFEAYTDSIAHYTYYCTLDQGGCHVAFTASGFRHGRGDATGSSGLGQLF